MDGLGIHTGSLPFAPPPAAWAPPSLAARLSRLTGMECLKGLSCLGSHWVSPLGAPAEGVAGGR